MKHFQNQIGGEILRQRQMRQVTFFRTTEVGPRGEDPYIYMHIYLTYRCILLLDISSLTISNDRNSIIQIIISIQSENNLYLTIIC